MSIFNTLVLDFRLDFTYSISDRILIEISTSIEVEQLVILITLVETVRPEFTTKTSTWILVEISTMIEVEFLVIFITLIEVVQLGFTTEASTQILIELNLGLSMLGLYYGPNLTRPPYIFSNFIWIWDIIVMPFSKFYLVLAVNCYAFYKLYLVVGLVLFLGRIAFKLVGLNPFRDPKPSPRIFWNHSVEFYRIFWILGPIRGLFEYGLITGYNLSSCILTG